MKLRWKILTGSTVLIAAVALWLTVTHYQAKNALAAYKKKLVAQGEEFDITKLTPPPPHADNGALNLVSLAGGVTITNQLPVATMMASGRARVSSQQEILPTAQTANLWSNLSIELGQKQTTIAAIELAMPDSAIQFPLDYQLGYNLTLVHLASIKQIEILLANAAILELRNEKLNESQGHLLASARLVRHFGGKEPTQISQLVRAAMGQIGINATWEALQNDKWTPDQLAEIQKEWEAFSFLDPLESTVAMDRATGIELFPMLRDSSQSAANFYNMGQSATTSNSLDELAILGRELVDDPAGSFKAIIDRYPRNWAWKGWWSYEEEVYQLETYQAALEAIRSLRKSDALALSVRELEQKQNTILKAHPNAGTRFISGLGPAITSKFVSKIGEAEVARRMLVTAIALKCFHLRERKYPNELKELMPAYIRAESRDPMNGQPLHYRANGDGTFLLYSVGNDGIDNDGDTAEVNILPAKYPGRSWTPWFRRRDAVWPLSATDEETKALHDAISNRRSTKEMQGNAMSGTNSGDTNAMKAFLDRYAPTPPARTN